MFVQTVVGKRTRGSFLAKPKAFTAEKAADGNGAGMASIGRVM
jgi:hypothetical protein